jgi:membrane-associated phospholipid phosphatase
MAVMRARQLVTAATAFAGVAVLASAADRGWLADVDRRAFEAVRARRGPAATRVAHAVSALAEPGVVYPVLALAGVAAARRDGWWRVGAPCMAVAGGAVARRRLSRLIARQRPPAAAWLIEPEGFSLPSKHTTLAVLAAGATARALGVRAGPLRATTVLSGAAIGASRVYLGVHWPTDVIAGWLFAEGWLCVVDRVLRAAITVRGEPEAGAASGFPRPPAAP